MNKDEYEKEKEKMQERLVYGKEDELMLPLENIDIFGDKEDTVSTGNEMINDNQKAFKQAITGEEKSLEDDIPYTCVLKEVKANRTTKSYLPTVDFIYEVDNGNFGIRSVVDTYVLYTNNEQYLISTFKRLNETLEQYNYELSISDTKNAETIANACQCLIGLTAKIKQYTVNGYKKYKVLATERQYNI